MSFTIPEQYRHVGSLLKALEALRNWRALVLMALTLVAAAATFMLLSLTHSAALVALGSLLSLLIYFYGASAVGIMLMQQAQNGESLSIGEAVTHSFAISHRLVGVALLAFLVYLGLALAAALLYLVCKIPGLGPLLYFFVLPLTILLFGLAYAALGFVVMPLAGPAVWNGEKVFDTVSILYAVIRQRLPLTIVLMVFLGILAMITVFVLGLVFWSGILVSTLLSTSILHTGGSLFGHLPMPGMTGGGYGGFSGGDFGSMGDAGGYGGGGSSGLMLAGMGGTGMLFAAMMALPGLVLLQGYCQIFLIVTDGLDVSAEKAVLRAKMDRVKKAAEEAKHRAEETRRKMEGQRQNAAAERQAQAAPPSATDTEPAPAANEAPAVASTCPACGKEVGPDDTFCGHCGHKLK